MTAQVKNGKASAPVDGKPSSAPKRKVDDYADLPATAELPKMVDRDFDQLSFDEVLAQFVDTGEVTTLTGSSKESLIGVRFLITELSFHQDDQGRKYVFAQCVTEDSRRVNFTDGSTGVMAQLVALWRKDHKTSAILVPNGLRKSEYTVEIEGVPKPSVTYYIA